MIETIIQKTFKVPAFEGWQGDGSAIARQLDVALMDTGFKLSGELLRHLSGMHPVHVQAAAVHVLHAVESLVGNHVRHNTYFQDFPENVPDTIEFWVKCFVAALSDLGACANVQNSLATYGTINLLDLPDYGRYQHSYEEMLAHHDEFIRSLKDRVTILHLGKSLTEEANDLYVSLAQSLVPLNEADRVVLKELAEVCIGDSQPETIPVRENKAIINVVRIAHGIGLLVDTATDVLRLACALSGGDVTLQTPTRFRSFRRPERRALMTALDGVIESSPEKLTDVNRNVEPWKRLGERLHPHEYRMYPHAQDVFAVARGEKVVRTLAASVEIAFVNGKILEAVSLLSTAPGMLFRSIDRILRLVSDDDALVVVNSVKAVMGKVSGRVILSVREHIRNRIFHALEDDEASTRIFANSKGTAWATADMRNRLHSQTAFELCLDLDEEIMRRLPHVAQLVVDKNVLGLALPLSDKNTSSGFGIMPRGSLLPISSSILRFFIHWKQKHERTDYDLSVLMLDKNFESSGQCSWTNLRNPHGTFLHSGDITNASTGASEFIDVELGRIDCSYLLPQVNIYAGEDFSEVEECFFGFMERTPEQRGKPFEARTVRMKSDLRGKGKVALPLVFARDEDGRWTAKWLHLYLKGMSAFNRVEANRINAGVLARSILEREYLAVNYLVGLMRRKADSFAWYTQGMDIADSAAFIGLERPEDLPAGSSCITLANLREIIPA